MSLLVAVDQVDKVFSLSDGDEYIALKGIDLTIKKGEFVSFIGHSGCGKSTLLNMIAGLSLPSSGVLTLEGKKITAPGPDRMVVFQNYSLLPWRTVRENIALAVNSVYGDQPKGDRRAIVEEHINLVGLQQAADKMPDQLSGGMKQRVAIARALAIRPKLLLLDEPFGALDALTRGNLQTQLMRICDENNVTAVMVTHDVDEAVLLSDRIVMLTNGPGAEIGNILEVDIPRPRRRMEVVEHPSYYSLRSEIIYFLNQQKRIKKLRARKTTAVARHGLEKVNLDIGFVPLTACAPVAIAKEKGFFAKHGLEEVNLTRETSWRGIVDGIAGGYLDAAQMPSGMPLWFSLGGHNNRPLPVVSALTMTRNGNAITLSRRFYEQGIHSLESFRDMLHRTPDTQHRMGMVHPSSMHNLLLRYWLAAGGIDPDKDLALQTIPPAQMVVDLKNNAIDGFCVGEPWNLRAAMDEVGFTIATDREIYDGHPGKVLGVREDWASAYPNTHIALTKALLDACRYCADPENELEIRQILSQRAYLGTPIEYIHLGDPNTKSCELQKPMREYAHHLFFGNGANRPSRTEHLWHMTQLARWGDVPFPRNWLEILERIVRVDVYSTAARELGLLDAKFTRGSIHLFDGTDFDAQDPIGYLNSLAIKRDITIAEVVLDGRMAALAA
ncbi:MULTISPECIES: nitrate ABC transporter ATP-binding protein [Cyanophyceae]|uniref:ABC transporter ATP-binding/substrate-binding protein n=1 Tax=Cyanophyceae TaxID=3028117 RepID=UPI0016837A0A|nr:MULTISPECIES: nitrate ABC transporter ATP-binding protein [Cyanophyceae]MBD1917454.1 ABC transporter substrate-binding protein [Phormidium sp. FACHB-77]MBD2032301.1 ABC transporter substrate-binding protein [Phormidium sp. FACHB-322]MBD2052239.1 ABC transporter substrate-binding protein [Leptolyngbya sp. FACHB-60]